MNEKFQEYLMGILEKTGEFLGNEIPEVAEQILTFGLVVGIVWIVFGLIFSVIGIYYLVRYFSIKGTASDAQDVMLVPGFIGPILGMAFILVNISDVFKIWLAPKLYLLEYAASLVK